MANSMYAAFETDKGVEQKGVVLDYGSFCIRIARAGGSNKRFQKQMESKTRPHRIAIKTETIEDEKATELLRAVYADSIILAWESKDEDGNMVPGIYSREGDILPFNRENVMATLANLPDMFKDIQEQAASSALFRTQVLEEAAKN